jgi:GntR family transcriptional regulator
LEIIDPANPIPKYLQISNWLRELIRSGRYRTGDKLPSEIELSKMCRVNRNTLRQAISELTAEGLLRKEKGMGTYVASASPVALKHRVKRISSFRDDLQELGFRERTKLLRKGIIEAPGPVADLLILGENRSVAKVCRLRTGNDLPLIYEESYLAREMFPGILEMDLTGSMYRLISVHYNIVLARCEQTIRAVNLRKDIAELLGLPAGAAGLYMESVTYTEKNIPIEVLFSFYRGDKCIFEAELGQYSVKGE